MIAKYSEKRDTMEHFWSDEVGVIFIAVHNTHGSSHLFLLSFPFHPSQTLFVVGNEQINSFDTFSGSGFDIFADEPLFPTIVNASISAGGLSLCLGLFYASIRKAQAETEEDDEKYMNGR